MVGNQAQANVLVTGANSGLGLGICLRLIDEHLEKKPSSQSLNIIFTTRSKKKADDTLRTLQAHLAKHNVPNRSNRVTFQGETNVELTNLLSIRSLAKRLNESRLTQVNAIICNAGIGGWSGIDWPLTIWSVVTDLVNATTWPVGKMGIVGAVTEPQFDSKNIASAEPPLGQIFCSNTFGHYMLVHWLMPLLRACPKEEPGKVIFVSSIEPQHNDYNEDDVQGLRTHRSYESSKRVADLLVLTSNHPATANSFAQFTALPSSEEGVLDGSLKRPDNGPPEMHVCQPGIVVTSVAPVPFPLNFFYPLGISAARLAGGVWSPVRTYAAAQSSTWLALTPSSEIIRAEQDAESSAGGKVKWGTRSFRLGTTEVRATDVDHYGINGSGKPFADTWWGRLHGRVPGAIDATKEDVENFVAQGARLWKHIENLRLEWQQRISQHDQAIRSPTD